MAEAAEPKNEVKSKKKGVKDDGEALNIQELKEMNIQNLNKG